MDFSPEMILLGVAWYVVFLFSLTIHEAAHAWAALRLGDPTAYLGGQVTLNPLPHIKREPFGTILLPLLSYGLMGWMIGWASAPYNPAWANHYPKRAGLMALAGPVSNLLVTIGAGIGLRLGLSSGFFVFPPDGIGITSLVSGAQPGVAEGFAVVLSILFSLNLLLFLFNLIPLPPLDGSSVIQLVLSEELSRKYRELLAQPMMSLLGLVIAWKLFGQIFWPIFGIVLAFLYAGLT